MVSLSHASKEAGEQRGEGVSPAPSPLSRREKYRSVFLRSPEWSRIRQARLAADSYSCQCCGSRSNHNDVHHLFYPRDWNKSALSGLRTLCRECHVLVEALSAPGEVHSLEEGVRRFKLAVRHAPLLRQWRSQILSGRIPNR